MLYTTHGERHGQSRAQFFSKRQPCFRASPLTRRYSWGLHSDSDGKVAIYSIDSIEYIRLASDASLKQLRAMASTKAGRL